MSFLRAPPEARTGDAAEKIMKTKSFYGKMMIKDSDRE